MILNLGKVGMRYAGTYDTLQAWNSRAQVVNAYDFVSAGGSTWLSLVNTNTVWPGSSASPAGWALMARGTSGAQSVSDIYAVLGNAGVRLKTTAQTVFPAINELHDSIKSYTAGEGIDISDSGVVTNTAPLSDIDLGEY